MSLKAQWYKDKFAKKRDRGFRGYPVATVAFYESGKGDATLYLIELPHLKHLKGSVPFNFLQPFQERKDSMSKKHNPAVHTDAAR